MARLLYEDAILFMIAFEIIMVVLPGVGLFDAFWGGQRYNVSTASFETYIPDYSPMLSPGEEFNDTLGNFGNTSQIDANGLLASIGIVQQIGLYLRLITTALSSSYIAQVLAMFVGAQWAFVIHSILGLITVIGFVFLITGRIRRS